MPSFPPAILPERPPADASAPVVLLVDNEVRNLDVLESILGQLHCRFVRAQTAQEALLALIDGEFAAIVLDIHMPGTGGIELAQLIKQRKKTAHIPIIFLTAYRQEDKDVVQGYEVGAVDFLTKPINPQILRSKVAVFVDLFQKTRELASLNEAMKAEILQRQTAEQALQEANQALENRVQERVAALAELMRQKESQSRLFDTTLASLTDHAYTFDLEGNWVYANRSLLELWGKSLDQIRGKSARELGFRPELAEQLRRKVLEVVATRQPVTGEFYFTSAADVEDLHEYSFSPVLAPDGTVTAVCGTTRLTTERKRAEALEQSHRRILQLIAEDAPLPQILHTLVNTVQSAAPKQSKASILLLDSETNRLRHGAAPGLPETFNQALHGMIVGPACGPWCAAILSRRPTFASDLATDECATQVRDLTQAHDLQACWAIPILSGPREVLGVLAVFHREPRPPTDLELKMLELVVRAASIALERIQRDEVLRESERRSSQLVRGLPVAVYTTDTHGRLTLFNEAAVQLWGRQPEIGKDRWCGSHQILRPDGAPLPHYQSPMALTLQQDRPVRGEEIVIVRPDASRRTVLPYTDAIRDASGRLVGSVNMLLDITESKQSERELARAHQELLAASRAKDEFLAALSHELRTPLNPVLLIASQSAEDPELTPDLRERFARIRNGVELEARLIDDLLDITRITRGILSLNIGLVDVHSLLREAAFTVQSDIHQKKITSTMDFAAEPALVKGDAVRLQQVFWNVLKNAAKFTPEAGRILIRTHVQSEPPQVSVSVQDSGIGITPTELSHIFEAFTQGEHARDGKSHRFGGLGLGLAICRMIVDLHSGSIRASSEGRDCGSTFTIILPLVKDPQAASGQSAGPPPPGSPAGWPERATALRILLVEDHEPTRNALRQLLSRRCGSLATAASLAEARACADAQAFDLLISDIGLPDGTGYELMQHLRATNPKLLGIALTGYGLEEDIARSRQAGFAAHLIKPVRAQSLGAALAAALV